MDFWFANHQWFANLSWFVNHCWFESNFKLIRDSRIRNFWFATSSTRSPKPTARITSKTRPTANWIRGNQTQFPNSSANGTHKMQFRQKTLWRITKQCCQEDFFKIRQFLRLFSPKSPQSKWKSPKNRQLNTLILSKKDN